MIIDKIKKELYVLQETGGYRALPVDCDKKLINLSSNDYLGIAKDTELFDEFTFILRKQKIPFSSASSRLLSGSSGYHTDLESYLESLYEKKALVFNSGYHTNIGILPALCGTNDLIISDKAIHASLYDGISLSKAKFLRFRHADYAHLERILYAQHKKFDNIFLVVESIYSMDGDKADLKLLIDLKKKFDFVLYVDEAHAVGVYGDKGLGLLEENNLIRQADIIVGTFGKALASVGAFVICNDVIKKYLINKSRSFIFTTALPPVNMAWTKFVLSKLSYLEHKRRYLANLSAYFADNLKKSCVSHIIPFITGSNSSAIKLSEKLKNNGFFVQPIRYPTVPKGSERIRISLNASLKYEEIDKFLKLIKNESFMDKQKR